MKELETKRNNQLIEAAKKYRMAQLSPLPCGKNKVPTFAGWQKHCDEVLPLDELESKFNTPATFGISLANHSLRDEDNNKVLELVTLDFDVKQFTDFEVQNFWHLWLSALDRVDLRWIWDESPREQTKSGGFHAFVWVEHTPDENGKVNWVGNKKLLRRAFVDDAGNYTTRTDSSGKEQSFATLLETRGHGGQTVVFPTEGYKVVSDVWLWDGIDKIPCFTENEWQEFVDMCISLEDIQLAKPVKSALTLRPQRKISAGELLPGDHYNRETDIRVLLRKYGWTLVHVHPGQERWLRPHDVNNPPTSRDSGSVFRKRDEHGNEYDVIMCWSGSVEKLEPGKIYSPFSLLAAYEYDNDFSKAGAALIKEGYGVLGGWNYTHFVPMTGDTKWLVSSEFGIQKQKMGRDGTIGYENVLPHMVWVDHCVVGDTEANVKIVWEDKTKGKLRSAVVPRRKIADSRQIMDMVDLNWAVNSNTASDVVEYFADMMALHASSLPVRTPIKECGWNDIDGLGDTFIIGADANQAFRLDGGEVEPGWFEWANTTTRGIKTKGTLENWIEAARRAKDRPDWIMALSAGFLAPALHIIGGEMVNPVVEIFGSSSQGKTIAIQYAASVWGNPSQTDNANSRYLRDWNGTQYAIMQQIAAYRHLPCCIDEATTAGDALTRGAIAQVIYGFSQGTSKAQGKADGGLRDTVSFSGVLLTSSEVSLTDHLRTEGTQARLISLEAFGTSTFEFAKETKSMLCSNYGHAGGAFLHAITHFKGGVERWADLFRNSREKKASIYQNDDPVRQRAGEILVTLHVMAAFVNSLFKLDWDVDGAFEQLRNRIASTAAAKPRDVAFTLLRDYYVMNKNAFVHGPASVPDYVKPLGRIVSGSRGVEEHVAFLITPVKELLEKNGYNLADLVRGWEKSGVLISGGSNKVVKIADVSNRCLCVKMDALNQLRHHDDDELGNDMDLDF